MPETGCLKLSISLTKVSKACRNCRDMGKQCGFGNDHKLSIKAHIAGVP